MEQKRPNRLSQCTWKANATDTPHTVRQEPSNRNSILPNILEAIGQTPLVRLNNIPQLHGLECEIFAKCEFMNPGGSVKDRIAYRMIQDAEEKGILKPGSTIIEPTSGNTGIGLAMVAAVKGYRCIIVMPEKMSNEKVQVLRALGAEIVRTPTEAAWDSPESHISIAQKIQEEIPNSVILDQYTNSGNPLAHYDQTAMEIWKQCDGRLDYVIVGAGTGGTVTGIGRKLKELDPKVKIIAVDPIGSILALPSELNKEDCSFYEVEGIGYDFLPTVLDHSVVDKWIKSNDYESLNAARMLIKQEGLLCGGSSGAALSVCLKIAKDIPANKRVVVVLPDGIRNYMTKFVSDNWMKIRDFLDIPSDQSNKWWSNYPVSILSITKPPVLYKTATCEEAIRILKTTNSNVVVIIDDEEKVKGVLTMQLLMNKLVCDEIEQTDCIENIIIKQFVKVISTITLIKLSLILENESYAVVVDHVNSDVLVGIVNHSDIVNFISNKDNITNGST
ncbi:PREDICTED: cystathionine beta-synthase [Polistes dominula]|uniref:Cystathionine beta-synthase n=1 Tax=Polistes dominula TaxID=743375 RepID=A0ABM1IIN0_POLDO|nr:PREDICTED: cystathionine beta-synthase [Polistes dominula]XP_015180067.1 PREDICTED: cystathionine beta-synthase [Polistes dominula]XP_015180068.1 PREDICTED: cystathionine beta-synthase [Polistes dominula]